MNKGSGDKWIPTNGKKPDLPDNTLVDVKFAGGGVVTGHKVKIWKWTQDGGPYDITHYCIHQPAPDVQTKPVEPDEERLAMEAVMESIDPATWPGLTTAQRCALGRFAKPQPAEQPPALARYQPCGCVVCTCEHETQCQGCGANHCGTHPVGQIPGPVYQQPAPDVEALVEALKVIQKAAIRKDIHTGVQAGVTLGCIAAICDVTLAAYHKGGSDNE